MALTTLQVQQLYLGYYGRPADPVGLAYWQTQTLEAAKAGFAASAEFTNQYVGMSVEQQVNQVYINLLGREADLNGLLYWSNEIVSGRETIGTLVMSMQEDALGRDVTTLQMRTDFSANFTLALDTTGEVLSYSGQAAAEAARAAMANIVAASTGDTSTLTAALAKLDATVAEVVAGGGVAGQTFTLTAGVDTVAGTSGNDTFSATYTVADGMTLQGMDSIDGGDGTDTLYVSIGAAGTHQPGSMKGVETVSANFTAAGTLSMLTSTGVTTIENAASIVDAIFSNIGSATTALKVSNTDKGTDFGFTAAAVSGSSDTANVTLSNVAGGTLKINGTTGNVETVALTSSGNANTVTTLTTTNAAKLTVAGDQNLTVTNNLDASILTVDASTATGAVDLDFGGGAMTVTGGTGNDSFSFEAAGAVNATGGAGNDTFTFDATGTFTTADTVAGGDGTDTLVSTAAEAEAIAAALTKVSGLDALRLSNAGVAGATLGAAYFGSDVKTVTLAAGTAGAYTVNMNAGSNTLNLGAALGGDLTANDTGTATADALTIANTAAATNVGNAKNLTIGGFETVTVNTSGTGAATAQTLGTIGVTADTGGTSTVNFTGSNGISTGAITANVINASGLTGTAALAMGAAAVGVTSITGSANADTLVGDASSSIDGGAGNDTITGGAENDTLVGGNGNDAIISGAGNDNLSGGEGDDTLTLDGNLATGDVIDGGDGTDTVVVTNASLTTLNGYTISTINNLNNAISNLNRVKVSDALNQTSFDMARLDSLNYITLAGGWTDAETLAGLGAGATIVLNTGETAAAAALTLSLADSTGSSDAITVNLVNDAGTDFDVIKIADIETLTLTSAEATATTTAETHILDVDATGLKTLILSGTESMDLTGLAISATTINASGVADSTAGTAPNVKITGGGGDQSITGTAGADTIDGGGGADTIDGGAGADSLTGGAGVDSITAGAGADTVIGGAGNDSINLTETTAAVDQVNITYSEAGTNIDAVTGFTTGAGGDKINLSLAALELGGTSGIHSAATNFQQLNANTDAAAGAAAVQVLTGAATAGANTVFVLSGTTFASKSAVEDALESGGSYELTVSATDADIVAEDAFIVVWSDGTNAHVMAARVATDPGTAGKFASGALATYDLVTLTGVSSISSTTFHADNFAWIA